VPQPARRLRPKRRLIVEIKTPPFGAAFLFEAYLLSGASRKV